MKEIKKTATLANATAIDLGPLAELKDYVLELGPNVKIPGKVFGGAAVQAGGADFSFQVFAPGTEGGFYHTHKDHEELYFFLSARVNIRLTARTFRFMRAPSFASRPPASAPCAIRARHRSLCSASSTRRPNSVASIRPTARFCPNPSSGDETGLGVMRADSL